MSLSVCVEKEGERTRQRKVSCCCAKKAEDEAGDGVPDRHFKLRLGL